MKEKKIKVLFFVDRMLRGGIQSLIIDWVANFDKNKIQCDFLLLDDGNEYELEKKLKEYGCNIYKLDGIWLNTPLDFVKYRRAIKKFYNEHKGYDVVHMHSSSKNYLVLKYAKKNGINKRIAHSHNVDFQTEKIVKKMIGNIFKIFLKYYATDYLACSNLAGEWLYGKRYVEKNKVIVIHNAIEYNKFKYNINYRNKIRNKYNIGDNEILIGHVGRFTEQKNHEFLIEIFRELHNLNNNYKLILIGTGEKEQIIKEKVKEIGVENRVIFAGFQKDANEFFSAMDLFLLPSKHEGLPVVGVEAQAAGLPVFFSEKVITNEVKIARNAFFISLNKNAKEWADIIFKTAIDRQDNEKNIIEKGYILDEVIKKLMKIYFS